MNFDELDRRLRVFETAHDHCALPGLYLVARLDGRGFTHLTRERRHFAAPFDERGSVPDVDMDINKTLTTD